MGKVCVNDLDDMKDVEEDEEKNEPITTDRNVVARGKFLKYVQCHSLQSSSFAVRGMKKDTLFFNFPLYIDHQIQIKSKRISMDVSCCIIIFFAMSF